VVVEGLRAGIETDELRWQCVDELDEAGILLRGRGFAHEKEDNGDEGDDLEDQDEGWHFDFPSPLRIASGCCESGRNLELVGLRAASKDLRETNFSLTVEDVMAKAGKDQNFDEILSKIGPDATATFDNSLSNPTEHASSEATNAATAVDAAPAVNDDEELEEEDDDAAALEEDDEIDEEEDVDDEAGV
jgi:hypothetical protein